jgi:hypothetical protein
MPSLTALFTTQRIERRTQDQNSKWLIYGEGESVSSSSDGKNPGYGIVLSCSRQQMYLLFISQAQVSRPVYLRVHCQTRSCAVQDLKILCQYSILCISVTSLLYSCQHQPNLCSICSSLYSKLTWSIWVHWLGLSPFRNQSSPLTLEYHQPLPIHLTYSLCSFSSHCHGHSSEVIPPDATPYSSLVLKTCTTTLHPFVQGKNVWKL